VMYHKKRSTNKLYPRSSAASMNAVDHPYGNKRSSRKSKSRPTPRNAPPGRKVGLIAPRRTGRKKK
jgi:large subunit ribosomal protein L2